MTAIKVKAMEDQQEHDGAKLASVADRAEERAGLRRGIYLLPNLITTGALFSGLFPLSPP